MIRRATPADAEALSHLSRTCFTQTSGTSTPPPTWTAFLDEGLLPPTVLRAELDDPERATWLLFRRASLTRPGRRSPPTTTRARPNPETRPRPRPSHKAPIGYVTACPAHLPHPDVAPGDGEVQRLYMPCRDTKVGAAGPRCCAPRWTGSSTTARAPSGSVCGAKTTGRSASTRATASKSSATTPSWWATTPTTNSSRAASRERSLRE